MPTPITEVKLLNDVKFDMELRHSRDFASLAAQTSYFNGKVISGGTFTNLTHRREETGLRLGINVETARTANYMMYKNGNKSTKWYYAFIDKCTYINDTVTMVEFTLDPIQSYFFEMKTGLKDSFVERRHATFDALVDELVSEDLDIGTVINRDYYQLDDLNDLVVITGATYDPGTSTDVLGDVYRGVYSGLQYRWFDTTTGAGVDALTVFLEGLATAGKVDSLVAMYMFPKEFVDITGASGVIDPDDNISINIQVTRPGIGSTIDGYEPYNNKLFTYPYNYLEVTNGQGGSVIYRYERFNQIGALVFTVQTDMGPSPTLLLRPANYLDLSTNNQEHLTLNDYPVCAWTNDYFSNWFAQNKRKLGTQVLGGAVAGIAGAVTGNLLAAGGGVASIAASLGQLYDASIKPDQQRGTPSGSVQANVDMLNFGFYRKMITAEYAEIIDMHFQMFGYQHNTVETPTFNHRVNWDYVKTKDCNLFMNAPNEHTERIKKAFNDGITFWHDDDIGNYSRANGTIL